MSSLQIEQDLEFQRRDWKAQRVMWVGMAALVVAALAGVFGPGPLSHQQAVAAGEQVHVDYLRFARYGAPADLTVTVDPSLVRDGAVEVALPRAYLREFEVQGVSPRPSSVAVSGDEVVFTIASRGPGGPVDVEFSLRSRGMGPVEGWVRAGGADAPFWQFVWP